MNFFKSRFFILCLVAAIVLTLIPTLIAAFGGTDLLRSALGTVAKPFTMCGSGIANAFNGFVEIFTQYDELKEENAALREELEALKEKEVLICLNLEAYAGQSKVSDFGGGKVTVSVPFEVPAEKKGSDFCVAYIDDNGKMTAMPTTYKDGILVFETTHFSSYIVLEKIHLNDNPPTGDNGIAMALALMTVSAAAVILLGKKKAF